MKAIVMTAPGGPEVLQLQEVPDPVLQHPGDVLVQLKAAGVNPVDTKLRARGTYYPERMPAILGCDGAGVVAAVGSGAQRFKPGDPVYFCDGGIGGDPGTYAEFAVVDEASLAPKPASWSFAEAAAAPLVLITAWESLLDRARIEAGHQVLIHGGAGGVGHVAVQIARHAGARVACTVGDRRRAEWVEELGAEQPILYRDTDFVEAAREWTGGLGVDMALDTVGGTIFQDTFGALRHYGDLVTLLQPSPATDWSEARLRNLRISLELMLTPMIHELHQARRHQADILARCGELAGQGELRIQVQDAFPLADAAAAHRRLEAGSLQGKLVLQIGD